MLSTIRTLILFKLRCLCDSKNGAKKASSTNINALLSLINTWILVALERALSGPNPDDVPDALYKSPEATIPEDDEPPTPNPSQNMHKRESADTGDDFL